jgi:hypothetical protein
MSDLGRELGWDDQIENDSPEYILLPEGDYNFEIVEFERGRHGGSEKLPPCNKAIVHVKITAPEGSTTIKHNLFLHTKTEGILCSFFSAIGQRRKGERITMNWGKVVGSTGRCKIGVRTWKNDEGKEMTFNEIKNFYEPDEPKQTIFTPGSF